jgi:hypothetical protein
MSGLHNEGTDAIEIMDWAAKPGQEMACSV